jgi:hypothetical protein
MVRRNSGARYVPMRSVSLLIEPNAQGEGQNGQHEEGGWAGEERGRDVGTRKYSGLRAQEHEQSCVPAATRNAIYLRTGADIPESVIANEIDPDHGSWDLRGTDPTKAVPVLQKRGINASEIQVSTIADITKAAKSNPLLIGAAADHRVILVGITDEKGLTFRVLDSLSAGPGKPIRIQSFSPESFKDYWNPRSPYPFDDSRS